MTLFKKILERFVKQKLIDPKDEVILLEMYKLYQENDLAFQEYLCEKYEKNSEVRENGYKKFFDFERKLYQLYREGLRSDFLDYARCYAIYLGYRCNHSGLAEYHIGFDKALAFLEDLCARNKNMISSRKLVGQLWESVPKVNMVETFKTFVENNKPKSYNSDVFLRLGKYAFDDPYRFRTLDSTDLFFEAYSCDNDNYEALRRYAYNLEHFHYKEEATSRKACEIYKEQIKTLEKVKNAGVMEFEEYKALMMAYFRCGRIYLHGPSGSPSFPINMQRARDCFQKGMNLLSPPEMYEVNFFYNSDQEREKILTYQKEFVERPHYQMRMNHFNSKTE